MRKASMILTQRQIPTRFTSPWHERVACPFCGARLVGQYKDIGTPEEYLYLTSEKCAHFEGYVAGPGGKPTALFRGFADQLTRPDIEGG